MSSSATMEDLPPEILLYIFEYFSPEDLLNVQNVCVKWKEIVRTSSVWDNFVYSPHRETSDEDMITFLQNCPMLKHFHTKRMPDKEKIFPAVLKHCLDLHSFHVEVNPTLSVPEIDALFSAFPKLDSLLIRVDGETPQIVDRLSKCTKLKRLILTSCLRSWDTFQQIFDGCVSLKHLSFGGGSPNVSKNDLLYVLKHMNDRLLSLQFGFSPITQEMIRLLGSFTKLEELSFHDATRALLVPVDFSPLANIRTLKCLQLDSYSSEEIDLCRFLNLLFCDPFPHLEKLDMFFYHYQYEKSFLSKICQCYPNLKHLRLYGKHPEDIADGFKDICKLEKLESLGFCSSKTITDDDIVHVGECLKLKNLDLSFNSTLTDNTLVHLSKCKTLKRLDLRCSSVSGHKLYLIAENLRRLKYLDVRRCENLQETFVCALSAKMPSLKIVQDEASICFPGICCEYI